MRIPVFAKRANPSVERPILKKSLSYATEQVAAGRAAWVDPTAPRKGIVCMEMLYFGERKFAPEENTGAGGYQPGLKFVPPNMEKNPLIARVAIFPIFTAARNWDWSVETDHVMGANGQIARECSA